MWWIPKESDITQGWNSNAQSQGLLLVTDINIEYLYLFY